MEKGYLKDMERVKWFVRGEINLVLEFSILYLLFFMYRGICIVFVNKGGENYRLVINQLYG